MRTTVKICGFQSSDVVKACNSMQVDQIGFVFAKSKRQVSSEQVHDMLQHLHKDDRGLPLAVGVFVNPTKEELAKVVSVAALDVIQLHGTESVELCRWVREELKLQVYKVFSVADRGEADHIDVKLQLYAGEIDALMLDTYDPVVGGGTGETFAWDRIPAYQQWTKQQGIPLLIAGGLNSENVAELIRMYEPDGVDVSSGVETDGIKDTVKMAQFVERVKSV